MCNMYRRVMCSPNVADRNKQLCDCVMCSIYSAAFRVQCSIWNVVVSNERWVCHTNIKQACGALYNARECSNCRVAARVVQLLWCGADFGMMVRHRLRKTAVEMHFASFSKCNLACQCSTQMLPSWSGNVGFSKCCPVDLEMEVAKVNVHTLTVTPVTF